MSRIAQPDNTNDAVVYEAIKELVHNTIVKEADYGVIDSSIHFRQAEDYIILRLPDTALVDPDEPGKGRSYENRDLVLDALAYLASADYTVSGITDTSSSESSGTIEVGALESITQSVDDITLTQRHRAPGTLSYQHTNIGSDALTRAQEYLAKGVGIIDRLGGVPIPTNTEEVTSSTGLVSHYTFDEGGSDTEDFCPPDSTGGGLSPEQAAAIQSNTSANIRQDRELSDHENRIDTLEDRPAGDGLSQAQLDQLNTATSKNTEQDGEIGSLQQKDTQLEAEVMALRTKDTELETKNTEQDTEIAGIKTKITDPEIKAAYERNSNTNAFTDTLKEKLENLATNEEAGELQQQFEGAVVDQIQYDTPVRNVNQPDPVHLFYTVATSRPTQQFDTALTNIWSQDFPTSGTGNIYYILASQRADGTQIAIGSVQQLQPDTLISLYARIGGLSIPTAPAEGTVTPTGWTPLADFTRTGSVYILVRRERHLFDWHDHYVEGDKFTRLRVGTDGIWTRALRIHVDIPASEISVDTSGFTNNLTSEDNTVQKVAEKVDTLQASGGGGGTDDQNASEVPVNTSKFDSLLSAEDNTVQKALDDLDDIEAHFEFTTLPPPAYYRYSTAANNIAGSNSRIDIWYLQASAAPMISIDDDYLTDVASGWTTTRPADSETTKTFYLVAYDENDANPPVADDSLAVTGFTELLPQEQVTIYYASSGTAAPAEGTKTVPSTWTTTPGPTFTVQTVFDPPIVVSRTETPEHDSFRVTIGRIHSEWLHLPFLISEIDDEIERFLDNLIGEDTLPVTGAVKSYPYSASRTTNPLAVPVIFTTGPDATSQEPIILRRDFTSTEIANIRSGSIFVLALRVTNRLGVTHGSAAKITLTVRSGNKAESHVITEDIPRIPILFTIPTADNVFNVTVTATGTYSGGGTISGSIDINSAVLRTEGSHQDEFETLINELIDVKLAAENAPIRVPNDFATYVRGMPSTVFRQASDNDIRTRNIVVDEVENDDGTFTTTVTGDDIAVKFAEGLGSQFDPIKSEDLGQGRYRYTSNNTAVPLRYFIADIPSNWSLRQQVTTSIQGTERSISGTLSEIESDINAIKNAPPPPLAVQEFQRALSLSHLDTTTVTNWAVSTAGTSIVRLATSGSWRDIPNVHNIIPSDQSIIDIHSNVDADTNNRLHNSLFVSTPGNINKVLTAFRIDIPRLSTISGSDPVPIFSVKQRGRDTYQTILGAFSAGTTWSTQRSAGPTETVTYDEIVQDTRFNSIIQYDDTTIISRTWSLPATPTTYTIRVNLEENGNPFGSEQTITVNVGTNIPQTTNTLTFSQGGVSFDVDVIVTYVASTRSLTIVSGGTYLPHRRIGNTSVDHLTIKVTKQVTETITHPSHLVFRQVSPTESGSSIGQGAGGDYFVVLYTNTTSAGNIEMLMATKEISTGNVRQYRAQDLGYNINTLDFSSIRVGSSIYEVSNYDYFSYIGTTAPTLAELGLYATNEADYLGLLTPGSTRRSSHDVVKISKDIDIEADLFINGVEVSTSGGGGGGTQGDSVELQFSAVGGTNDADWHDTLVPATDKFIRFRIGSDGAWSAGVQFVGSKGDKGDDGRSVFIQYSPDTTSANFHNPPYVDTDNYIRIRLGTPGNYSNAIRLKGVKGDKGDSVVIEYSTDGLNTANDAGSTWHTTLTDNDKYIRFTVGTDVSTGVKFKGDDGTGTGTGTNVNASNVLVERNARDTSKDLSQTLLRSAASNINPQGITWDGESVLIADSNNGAVWGFTNGARDTSKDLSQTLLRSVASHIPPTGITWDGRSVLVADGFNRAVWGFTNGARDTSKDLSQTLLRSAASNINPQGITWDGESVLIADYNNGAVWGFTNGARDTSKDLSSTLLQSANSNIELQGITWDGESVLVLDDNNDAIYGFTNGARDTSKDLSQTLLRSAASDIRPRGITWDGKSVLVTDQVNDVVWAFSRTSPLPTELKRIEDEITDDQNASEVSVTTTNFDNNLSSSDNTVQKALDTLDNINVSGGGGGAAPTFDAVAGTNNVYTLTGNMFFVTMQGNSNNTATHIIRRGDIPANPATRAYYLRINQANSLSLTITAQSTPNNFTITPTSGTIVSVTQL